MPAPRLLLIVTLTLTACGDEARTPAQPARFDVCPPERALAPVATGTQAAWLSVWSADPEQTWFAGGSAEGGAIAHRDGDTLRLEATPEGPALWWIWGTDATHLWAVGEGGRILRRDADGWRAEPSGLGEKAVLWGVWGSSANDLWAVGGANRRGGPKAVVLRSNGDGVWRRVEAPELPTEDPADPLVGLNLYKVWGAAADDVHLVGENGLALHWDGAALQRTPVDPSALMFTVAGHSDARWAVGGLTEGHAWRWGGDAWAAAPLPPTNPLNGVAVSATDLLLVGARGLLVRGQPGAQCRQRPDAAWASHTFHAASLGGGGAWVVGGDLTRFTDGVILSDRPLSAVELP